MWLSIGSDRRHDQAVAEISARIPGNRVEPGTTVRLLPRRKRRELAVGSSRRAALHHVHARAITGVDTHAVGTIGDRVAGAEDTHSFLGGGRRMRGDELCADWRGAGEHHQQGSGHYLHAVESTPGVRGVSNPPFLTGVYC